MKKVILACLLMLLITDLFAQAPEKMTYQAVIRDSNQALVVSRPINMIISILKDSINGISVYSETISKQTNENGLVTLQIGENGSFHAINWSNGRYYLKVLTDPNGGTNYNITVVSQLLSVPYAFHANTASSLSGDNIVYSHPNGSSEYSGNSSYSAFGMGVFAPGSTGGFEFNKIQLAAGCKTTTSTVYIEIYEAQSNSEGSFIPSSKILKYSFTDIWDTTFSTLRTISLNRTINIGSNKKCLILFSTKTAEKVKCATFNNNIPGNRLPFIFSLSNNYNSIFDEIWYYSSPPDYMEVPPKLLMDYTGISDDILEEKLALKQDNLKPRITIPSIIYTVVGTEINLWYDALILGTDCGLTSPKEYSVEIMCNIGKSKERCYSVTPVVADIGNHSLTIRVYDSNHNLIEKKVLTLIVVSAVGPTTTKNILMVGDSLTASNTITTTTRQDFVNIGGTVPNFKGTGGVSPNSHEGRGGWKFQDFATDVPGNPFWNNGNLDISNYRGTLNMGNDKFDVVTLQMGINDCFGPLKTETEIRGIINYAKAIITAFLSDNADCKIIIMLPSTDGNTKGGWAENYGASGYKSEYQSNIWRLRELIIDNFDGGVFNTNVSVGITGLVCDRYYGYNLANMPISARCQQTEQVHTNAVHPITSGYQQMGDAIFSQILKAIQ